MSRKTHVVALILLITFSSGCSRTLGTIRAQGLKGADLRKDAPTLSKEAYELIVKNDYDGAIKKAELAIKKDPNLAEAHKNLAIAYCDSGRVEQALAPVQKAISLAPNLDTAHYVYGKTLFKLQRLPEAIQEFQKAIRRSGAAKRESLKLSSTASPHAPVRLTMRCSTSSSMSTSQQTT